MTVERLKISQAGIDLMKDFEWFHAESYLCPAKILPQAWGSTIGITKDTPPVTMAEGEEMLKRDLGRFERGVHRLCPVSLNQGQYDALVSFSFNTGSLSVSTLRKKLLRGDYGGAANNFTRRVYAGGRRLAGLVRGREAERALFLRDGQ